MIQDWILTGVLVLLAVISLYVYVWLTRKRIDDLELTVNYLRDSYNKLFESKKDMEKEILEFKNSIEEQHGSMQVCSSTVSNRLSEIERRLDILSFVPRINEYDDDYSEDEEKAEPEEDEYDDSPTSEVEYLAYMEKFSDIVDTDNIDKPKPDTSFKWSHEGEIIGYRWVFPSKEQYTPIYGQRYMVVGVLHGHETTEDGSPFICTEEAMWDRYKFVIDSGERFDKVYAYIRMPNSSDIMKSILDMTLNDKED